MNRISRHQAVDVPEYILVIANSGRMLASEISKAGGNPLVIDLYADSDTCGSALDCIRIPDLEPDRIAPALDRMLGYFPVKHAVYGSGFENHPDSLEFLNDRLVLLGNSPDVFARLQNKFEFFTDLTGLDILYPEVAFAEPLDGKIWLIKPMQGQGGAGIKRWNPNHGAEPMAYWQRFETGTAHSALFLADGRQARLVGFNTQWTVSLSPCREFIFSGILNDCDLDMIQRELVADWLARCVPAFGLKGLNSLDFIWTGDRCLFLEINARPPASMQLYDGLLQGHILASQGVLPEKIQKPAGCSGLQVVYADHDFRVPPGFDWPEGSTDLPREGVVCRKGQPVCSIIARRDDAGQVLDELCHKQQHIVNQMRKV